MTARLLALVLISVVCLSAVAEPPPPTPIPTTSPTGSPAATLTQSVSELSAQRAAAERSQIYRAGATYSRWLDQVAKNSGSEFLRRPLFDRVTWMRLLTCVTSLGLLALITGWFLWVVRRRAGLLQSKQEQSWLAVSAAAIRKPLALFVWVVGGAFALMPDRQRHRFPPDARLLGPHPHRNCLRGRDHRSSLARVPRGSCD